jgi:hypothetical protein
MLYPTFFSARLTISGEEKISPVLAVINVSIFVKEVVIPEKPYSKRGVWRNGKTASILRRGALFVQYGTAAASIAQKLPVPDIHSDWIKAPVIDSSHDPAQ